MQHERAVPARGVPLVDRRGPAGPAGRRPPAGPAEPVRRLRRPARRRHRRLGRRLAGDRRPRQPRAAVAGARPAARGHRGPGLRARAPPDDLPRVRRWTPSAGSTRRCASPVLDRSDAEGLGRDDPGRGVAREDHGRRHGGRRRRGRAGRPPLDRVVLGRRPARPPRARCPGRRRAAGTVRCAEVLDGVRAGQEPGVDELVTLFARPRPGGRRRGRAWPTTCAARPSATPSPGCTTATSTTPTSAPSSAGSAASPRARCR